jgi:hypothetical protein
MKVLYFSDGKKAEVTGENGKYWLTKKAQYRKSNPDIVDVKEESDNKPKKKAEKSAEKIENSPKQTDDADKKDGDA